ncbi:MAG: ABC transporter permease [Promethearchaeota archaeon]
MNKRKSSMGILSWIFKNLKFIVVPGYKKKELLDRESEYMKKNGKRKARSLLKSNLTLIGIIIIVIVVTLIVFGPWISPYTFEEANLMSLDSSEWFAAPSPEHPLGQTFRGFDVLARIIYGAQSTLLISVCSVAISLVIGVLLGLIAAYYGGWLDTILMRIMDIILAFPGIVLAIAIIAISGKRTYVNLIIIFGLIDIPYFARLIRASAIEVQDLPYVDAAKMVGASKMRQIFRHILPNCIQPIIISFTQKIGSVIISLSVLSFLGFGDPSLIEWGNDISVAIFNMKNAPWASLYPSFMILITVLAFMLLGDGLRESTDPILRNK